MTTVKIKGDTGKGFFKLTASIYMPVMRRTRDDGVCPVELVDLLKLVRG